MVTTWSPDLRLRSMVDLGTVPEWIAAVGTAGAFFATAWLLWREEEARRRRHEEEAKGQARRVNVWAVGEVESTPDTQVIDVALSNSSEEPVYTVHVDAMEPAGDGMVTLFRISTLPPGEEPRIKRVEASKNIMRGAGTRLRIRFRDSQGIAWVKESPAGRLYRLGGGES